MSDSIFEKEPNTVFKSPADETVQNLTTIFHNNNVAAERTEPDWAGKLLKAKNEREKWDIRNARDAWQEEAQHILHQARHDDQDKQVSEVMKTPTQNRNEEFYNGLKDRGNLYFYPRIQRQMRADKALLKLGFYLKSKG